MIALTMLFFVKQKTAYEMRISDWSSDVCSSDLSWNTAARRSQLEKSMPGSFMLLNTARSPASPFEAIHLPCADSLASIRSEERRVGKECVSTCRSRWLPYH